MITCSEQREKATRKNHVGNVRLSYGIDPATGTMKIMEENNYYPFGLKHTNYNSDSRILVGTTGKGTLRQVPRELASNYNYKYNGKELQDELGLNFYDFGARNYDPAIGRWMNLDPLAEKSRRWTPYNYAYSNPVFFVDPDGMMAWGYHNTGDPSIDVEDRPDVGVDDGGTDGMPPGPGINQYIDDDGTFFWNNELKAYERYAKESGEWLGYFPYEESFKPNGTSTYIFDSTSQCPDFVIDKSRPDYDGKLTLTEANEWYRTGNGEPLLVNAGKIDLSPVKTTDFDGGVGSSLYNNFFLTSNQETGRLYGTINLTLEDKDGTVSLGKDGYLDTYDFDQKENNSAGRIIRNIGTIIGEIFAGKGTGYNINVYGNGKIEKPR
jgi:RHS repeat-associated protein